MEVKIIGQMDNTMDHTFESANRVYGTDGLAPTMNTCSGGGLQPKIIVAMRGRNPDNPSDRTPGIPTEQRLEPNSQGICNTLTSVQKDNLVLESAILTPKRTEYGKAIRKAYENGEIQESRHNMTELEPRTDGITNTLTTVQKDNLVLENVVIGGMQEHQSIKKDGVCTCLTSSMGMGGGYVPMIPETVKIKNNNAKGYEECVVGGVADFLYPSSTTRRGRVQENGNVSPTLTSENSGVCKIEKVGQISSDGSQYGTVIDENGLSATLSAGTHGYANNCIHTQYRIRKLTPLECWRLMGFSDEDFHKAEAVNSNTQLYKQAGNSIVVDVLEAIFRNLF